MHTFIRSCLSNKDFHFNCGRRSELRERLVLVRWEVREPARLTAEYAREPLSTAPRNPIVGMHGVKLGTALYPRQELPLGCSCLC